MFEVPMTPAAGSEVRRIIDYGEQHGELVEHLPGRRFRTGPRRVRAQTRIGLASILGRRRASRADSPPVATIEPGVDLG